MKTWHIVALIGGLAAAYYFLVYRKRMRVVHPVMAPKAAAGPSRKSRWRRALGSASRMAVAAGVPGASQATNIAAAGGLL